MPAIRQYGGDGKSGIPGAPKYTAERIVGKEGTWQTRRRGAWRM
jgi:hypothetical protein